jgi:hypothetical protein
MEQKQIPLRQYTREQVAALLKEDALEAKTVQIA